MGEEKVDVPAILQRLDKQIKEKLQMIEQLNEDVQDLSILRANLKHSYETKQNRNSDVDAEERRTA